MTAYERSGQPWREDPAVQVVDAMYQDISEDLGTEGPQETFGHPDESRVGHLVEDDEGVRADETAETIAHDTHDVEDLAVEELAMHYVDQDSDADDELPEDLRSSLDG